MTRSATPGRTVRSADDGWVMIGAVALLLITIVVGFALVAIVDTQRSQTHTERTQDASLTLADGMLRGASGALGAAPTPNGTPPIRTVFGGTGVASCVRQTPAQGASLASAGSGATVVAQATLARLREAFDTTGSTGGDDGNAYAQTTRWALTICPVATSDTRWDDAYVTRSLAPTSRYANRAWVVATASVGGRSRTVVGQVQPSQVAVNLPTKYAIATGRFASDVTSTTGAIVDNDLVHGLLSALLKSQRLITKSPEDGQPPVVGVRCALLSLLDSGLCLTGTVAGVSGAVNSLGLDPLGSLLGLNRSEQLKFWAAAGAQQLDAYYSEAQASNTYLTNTLGNPTLGGSAPSTAYPGDYRTLRKCIPTGSAGKVVVIERTEAAGCVIGRGSEQAKILIVKTGKVIVLGNRPSGTTNPTPTSFTGVLYALNQDAPPDVDPNKTSPAEVVEIREGGRIDGGVFVDGGGGVGIYPPPLSITNTLCSLLGPIGQITCGLLGDVTNIVDYLLQTLSVAQLVSALVPQLANYTAVSLQPSVIEAAATHVVSGAGVIPGTYRQTAATGL